MALGGFPRPMQHVLLEVCHQWHNSVCGAPQLWSSISILWPYNDLIDVEGVQRILNDVVRRSGNAPLDIALIGDAWDRVAYCFIPESHRWRSLVMPCTSSSQQLLQCRALRGRLPALEKLHFGPGRPQPQNTPEAWKEYVDALSLMLSNTPKLFCITGYNDLLALPMPWKHITDITLEARVSIKPKSPFHWSKDLTKCTSVRRLGIISLLPPNDKTNIRMPSVQDFRCTSYASWWIACLTLPALRTLCIRATALSDLRGLIERSGCELNALTIDILPKWDDSTISDFRAIIPYLPRLEFLKVHLSEQTPTLRAVPHLAELLDPVANANAFPLLAEFCLSLVHTNVVGVENTNEAGVEMEIMLRTALVVTESILRPTMRCASISLENISERASSLNAEVVSGFAEFVKLQARARSEDVLTRVQLLSIIINRNGHGRRVKLMDSFLH
ncbi:hypothetical protein CYLTODRAFT_416639 [Cylindrobasidium torrendii FP15055 ss-10]|uniref:F-box domain-containing protein n=1 Tax=Cylindrobasidium torrendii FP15055 ss-10 TaxID=1314674 RepID=A0A0D7BTY1_9AGAR|nr:hypothetical protein CYLTODRAFT_416639 [Cylindrobasidium torrendii FP15055 ss-10]